jgi:ribosome-binding protein aMBF1 (putative translation factor)
MAAAAARRVPLERTPTAADETKVKRQQHLLRVRLGINLRKFRLEAGLSQRALAMRADLSTNHISRCEQGRHACTTDFLVRVSYYLGTTPIALLSE